MTRQAISPRLATSTVRNIGAHIRKSPKRGSLSGTRRADVEGHAEHAAGVRGVDDPVVPQPRGRVVRAALRLVLRRAAASGTPPRPRADHSSPSCSRRMVASTDDACGPPMTEIRLAGHIHRNRGRVRPAAHGVVAGPERAADDDGQLGHPGRRDGRHHLGAVLRDAPGLVVLADHEAVHVLQEHQRDAALVAQLDEVGALERRLAEQHAVVGDDPHGVPVQAREPGHQRGAVLALELVQLAAVDQPRDDLVHVVRGLQVGGHHAVELALVDLGRPALVDLPRRRSWARAGSRRCPARSAARARRSPPGGP